MHTALVAPLEFIHLGPLPRTTLSLAAGVGLIERLCADGKMPRDSHAAGRQGVGGPLWGPLC